MLLAYQPFGIMYAPFARFICRYFADTLCREEEAEHPPHYGANIPLNIRDKMEAEKKVNFPKTHQTFLSPNLSSESWRHLHGRARESNIKISASSSCSCFGEDGKCETGKFRENNNSGSRKITI
jgi:hypothetical protein